MKKIIVATDYSAEAENALHYTASASREAGFQIMLFTLQNVSIHALNAGLPADKIDRLLLRKQRKLKELSDKISAEYGITVREHFATGDFYEELARCIESFGGEMVVVGMAEKSFEQDLLGNTTTKVLHRLKLPVLAIPLSVRYNGIKKILFACDIIRGVHSKVLDGVRSFADGFGSQVEVFHVNNKIEALGEKSVSDHMEQIEEGLNGISYQYKNVRSVEIVKAIKNEVELIGADLLIMVPYRYGFWNSLVHRSKTRLMASGSSIPLLSIPI